MKLNKYMENLNKASIKHPNAKGLEAQQIISDILYCEKSASAEMEELKKQIESMKCCGNCKFTPPMNPCYSCLRSPETLIQKIVKNKDNWQQKEEE